MTTLNDIKTALGPLPIDIYSQLGMLRPIPEISVPRNPVYDLLDLTEKAQASHICTQLMHQINVFNHRLDPAHEVGLCIVGVGGQGITFVPRELEAWDPSLIIIYGKSMADGQPVQVIQHTSQISIALLTVQRTDPDQPKRPIGFKAPDTATTGQPA